MTLCVAEAHYCSQLHHCVLVCSVALTGFHDREQQLVLMLVILMQKYFCLRVLQLCYLPLRLFLIDWEAILSCDSEE